MRFLVVQDYKENRRKCTLGVLEKREDISFVRLGHPLRSPPRVAIGSGILLEIESPPLCREDRRFLAHGYLVLVDSTWARTSTVLKRLEVQRDSRLEWRSLPPGIVTAYPRTSKLTKDPPVGLASVEALFAATLVLGEPRPDLLLGYRWAREFLSLNAAIFSEL